MKAVIIGAGGFAREVADVVDAMSLIPRPDPIEFLGYIVDAKYGQPGTLVNGKPILGGFDWLQDHAMDISAVCALGAPHLRKLLVERAAATGCRFFNAIHPRCSDGLWDYFWDWSSRLCRESSYQQYHGIMRKLTLPVR